MRKRHVFSLLFAAQAQAQDCTNADTCATFTCPQQNGEDRACVPTTDGVLRCIVPTCVAPCGTTADCPSGSVCFTLGCCGPATFCVPLANPNLGIATTPIPAVNLSGIGMMLAAVMLIAMMAIQRKRRIDQSQ